MLGINMARPGLCHRHSRAARLELNNIAGFEGDITHE